MARWVPDERTELDAMAADIAAVYHRIGNDLTRLAARQLAQGTARGETTAARALQINLLRDAAWKAVDALKRSNAARIDQLLTAAADSGVLAAFRELCGMTGITIPRSPVRPHLYGQAIAAVTADLSSSLEQVGHRILRYPDDLYRRAVGMATPTVLTGGTTHMAQQRAWQTLISQGVGGFTDKAGRNWNLATYVEMATRTAARKAWEDQHIAVLDETGVEYFTIAVGSDSCKPCVGWSGKILTNRGTAGDRQDKSILTGEPVTVHVDGTVSEWRARRHPNDRCRLVAWQPGTPLPKATTYDPEREAQREKLRELEREVRKAKEQGAAAINPEMAAASKAKVRELQAEIREHVDATGLKRQRNREQVNLGRSMHPEEIIETAEMRALPAQASEQAMRRHAEGFTKDERDAAYQYTANSRINGSLRRGERLNAFEREQVRYLDQAMDARRLTEPVTVFRTIDPTSAWGSFGVKSVVNVHSLVGKALNDPGYTSTTRTVEPLASIASSFPGERMTMQLIVPKGVGALWLKDISAIPGEDEILLERGLTVRITSAPQWDQASGTWRVLAEILGRPQ